MSTNRWEKTDFEFEKAKPAVSTNASANTNGSLMATQMATTIRLLSFFVSPRSYTS